MLIHPLRNKCNWTLSCSDFTQNFWQFVEHKENPDAGWLPVASLDKLTESTVF